LKDYSFEMCEAETLNRKTFALYIYRNGKELAAGKTSLGEGEYDGRT
jgi:hypothetical protein